VQQPKQDDTVNKSDMTNHGTSSDCSLLQAVDRIVVALIVHIICCNYMYTLRTVGTT